MDINERIKNIGKYFAIFNVNDGVVCVGVRFPDKWTLFDTKTICDEFHIQIQVKDGTTYFLCDINDGFESVFNAVDFIIEQNRELEEKTNLLREKVEQLRSLFEQEPFEHLKTLRFVFDDEDMEEEVLSPVDKVTLPVDIKEQLRKNSKKSEKEQETNNNVVITVQDSDKLVIDNPVKNTKRNKKKNNSGDSSLMNFVKDTLDNE